MKGLAKRVMSRVMSLAMLERRMIADGVLEQPHSDAVIGLRRGHVPSNGHAA